MDFADKVSTIIKYCKRDGLLLIRHAVKAMIKKYPHHIENKYLTQIYIHSVYFKS